MLTMKHVMHPKVGECSEYVRPIGSYVFKTKDDYVQFLAFDDLNENGGPSIWSGWKVGEKIKNPFVAMIYVMNDAGATVANYRYVGDLDKMEDGWPELPASEPEQLAS